MTGGGGSTRRPTAAARSRGRPSEASEPEPGARRAAAAAARRRGRGDHGPLRLMDVRPRTLALFVIASLALVSVAFVVYTGGWWEEAEGEGAATLRKVMRSVTPLSAPRMMDLPQFQSNHKESLYWGTYRPNVYLGIRARTPLSLIAGLMWIGLKNGQYFLRHVCQDSDELSTFGWTAHNGRDYGRQVLVDHGLFLTTSFLKEKGESSGYGGDWAVRLDANSERSGLSDAQESTTHLFFYVADETGNQITMGSYEPSSRGPVLLASGSHEEIGDWELYLRSEDNLEIHRAGFKSTSMHNLSDLVQQAVATNAMQTGNLNLPDITEDSSNIMVYQVSIKTPAQIDIVFLSGSSSKSPVIEERISKLTGPMLSTRLETKQKEFEEKYDRIFNVNNKIDSRELSVGRAALSSLLGGVGYFYGQSKIALPKGFTQKNGDKYIPYWPAALYTAVPSRSFFPRGFLWDEGFHQLVIWRWDVHISMDIIGHWLDLLNSDGWIPREQILGAEALSKVPEEFVLQYTSNGNPPTLFLAIRESYKQWWQEWKEQLFSTSVHTYRHLIDPDYAIPDNAADDPVPPISKSGKPFNLHPASPVSAIGYNAPTLEALTFQRACTKTTSSRPRLETSRASPKAAASSLIKAFKGVQAAAGSSSATLPSTTTSTPPSEQQTGTSVSTPSMQAPQPTDVDAPQPVVVEAQTKRKALTDAEAQQKRQKSSPALASDPTPVSQPSEQTAPAQDTSSAIIPQGPTTDAIIEDIPSASSADPSYDPLQAAPSSQAQEIALKQEQDSPDSLFSFAIDVSDDDGEEASSSLALGTISSDTLGKLETLLNLLQQDTAQLVIDSDPARSIFKTIRGQVSANVEEIIFPAVHLESRQLQYQRAVHRIADRTAQSQLKEEMLQLKQTADEKHKNINNLQASSADIKQKISDLSAKKAALLAELEKVETALTQAKQEEDQLPDAIKALQQKRDAQARKALALKKKIKPVEGSVDEDAKELKEADEIRLRAISAIQALLN